MTASLSDYISGNSRDQLLDSVDNTLMHYSDAFFSFLNRVLVNTQIRIIESRRRDKLAGFLPLAVCENERYGTVINSLPFFGSHGGPIAIDEAAKADLLGQLADLIDEYKPRCATIIENPFTPLIDKDLFKLGFNVCDNRITQQTLLQTSMNDFHMKTRNAIRKGQKLQQTIQLADSQEDWKWMQGVHERSIISLGGVPKSIQIFEALRVAFGASAQLWIGKLNGRRISGVVVINYRHTIEYFTPVIEEEYRNTQALSATIYEVMQRSALKGGLYWNWGGTWKTQESLYRFKNRWAAGDFVYRYFNRILDKSIIHEPISELILAFPHFYLFKYQS